MPPVLRLALSFVLLASVACSGRRSRASRPAAGDDAGLVAVEDAGVPRAEAGDAGETAPALSVHIVSPAEGAQLEGTTQVRVAFKGDVRRVRYFVDGQPLADHYDAVDTVDWNTCHADDGIHTLRVEVEDEPWQGHFAFDEQVVSVRNRDAVPVLRGRSAEGMSRLDWTFCGAPDRFDVFWQTRPGVSTSSARLETSQRYLVHRGVPRGEPSYYRVAAHTARGQSALSNEVALRPESLNARLCSVDGWCWDRGAVQGEAISALWADSDDEVVAFGTPASMHWDGLDWRPLGQVIGYATRPAGHAWGSGPNDIWLMQPQPQHWDGQSWANVELPLGGIASGVWGNAADDVWAAGSGELAHWNGSSWIATHLEELDQFHVMDVWTDGAGGVWLAMDGIYGQDGSVGYFDGSAFRVVLTGQERTSALWGSGPDDVWVVGHHGTMHHWDGTSWTTSRHGIEHLLDVHGCGRDQVWAVGDFGLILRFDGAHWQRERVATRANLLSVVCSGERTWVGGERGELLEWTRESGWSTPRAELAGPLRGIAAGVAGPVVVGEYETVLTRDASGWHRQSGTLERHYPNVDLKDMHGRSADDIWAVGAHGAVVHWDGTHWQPQEPVTSYGLNAVWANGPDDVWAAGQSGVIIHFDGAAWTPLSAGSTVVFDDLWGAGRDDVWAAGWDGLSHWDGTAWHTVPSDEWQGQSVDHLWGSGPNDVWATTSHDQVLRWDGSGFRVVDVGFRIDAFIGNVHGTGPGDVWIFQDEWFAHFDGTAWLRTDWGSSFNPSFGQVTPSGTLWLLGGNKTRYGDGTTWTPAPVRHVRGARSMFALDDEHVYTVGTYATIQRWNGTDWEVESPTPANPQHYGDVWIESEDSLWVVGDYGTIRHWNGEAWEEHTSGTLAQLFAVSGSGPDDIWAGGEAGTLLHYDGISWTPFETGLGLPINDLLTLAADNVIAVAGSYGGGWVTYHGTVLRWNGEAWYPDHVPNVPGLIAAWAVDRDDIWAVGDAGVSIHFDGLEWTEVPTPLYLEDTLLGVWARDRGAAWAVGTLGSIIRWDGSTWQRDASPTRLLLHEVGGNDEAVWAVGADGAILRRALD